MKRITHILGLLLLAALSALAGVSALIDGHAQSGRIGGFQIVSISERPFLFWFYTIGGIALCLVLIFKAWREFRAYLEWRRFQSENHPLSGVIDCEKKSGR